MALDIRPEQALNLLYAIALGLVQETKPDDVPDLTLRQLAILLTIRIDGPPHTVRGLAKRLGVTKPVVTRALDAMGKQAIVARHRDEADRRNVIVQCTTKGVLYVDALAEMVAHKASNLV